VDSLAWVLLAIVLGDAEWFKILGVGFLRDVRDEGGKRSLTSSSWYLLGRALLLASMMRYASRSSLIFCLRSIVGASWRLASNGASP
jgi:hypothetical protein